MSVDTTKIKPGDYVTVRAKVMNIEYKTVPAGEICIVPDMHAHRFQSWNWVLPSAIVGHEPAPEPLKVGDVVTHIGIHKGSTFSIMALFDGKAWVSYKKDSGKTGTFEFKLDYLRRVEP